MAAKITPTSIKREMRLKRLCQIVALCPQPAKYRCKSCGRRFCEDHKCNVPTPFVACPRCLGGDGAVELL